MTVLEVLRRIRWGTPALLMAIFVVGSVVIGLATATEAAGLAVGLVTPPVGMYLNVASVIAKLEI